MFRRLRRAAPPRTPSDGARLHVERHGNGTLSGWAHDPAGEAHITLEVADKTLMTVPRTVARADVDAAVGAGAQGGAQGGAKGFSVDVDALATLLALADPADRPEAALTFAGTRHAIPAAPPVAPCRTLRGLVADLWLADTHHLRLRTEAAVTAVTAAQLASGALTGGETATAPRESLVTLPLAHPLEPVLLVLHTDGTPVLGIVPFPSLLRGGVHEAEGIACAADGTDIAHYAYEIASALITRPRARTLRLAPPRGIAATRAHHCGLAAFLARHARIASDPADEALAIPADAVPTLASLVGGGRGILAARPAPNEALWFWRKTTTAALDALIPTAEPAPSLEPDGGRPLLIRPLEGEDTALETRLHPVPEAPPQPLPSDVTLVRLADRTADPALVEADTPPGVTVYDPQGVPLDTSALAQGPVLFLDRAVVLHDLRTLALLADIARLPGIATAGCLIVREWRAGDTTAAERASAGLMPCPAAAHEPFRPPFTPMAVVPTLAPRDVFLVAANHPACVMVSAAALEAHGAALTRVDARALLELMRRAREAGLQHAVTTATSVFDLRAEPPPLPTVPLPAFPWPAASQVSIARRIL